MRRTARPAAVRGRRASAHGTRRAPAVASISGMAAAAAAAAASPTPPPSAAAARSTASLAS